MLYFFLHICQISFYEVINIRKFLIFLLALILIGGAFTPPVPTQAATMQSYVGAVTTGGGSLYVRQSPSTGSRILASLPKGSYVTLLSRSGSWWYVEYAGGRYGYCHGKYITPVEGTAARVDTDGDILNVRTGPGTSYSRITAIPHGQVVLVRSTENGWSRILYNGTKLGYVSSKFLTGGQSGGSSGSSSGYKAISLSVPSFKQQDSRWAHVQIGASGKTIGQIGCVTTGIAMIESYRTGTTIYPDAMSKRLSYSPTGGVYWPRDYTPTMTKDGYLSVIYSQLQAGKAVLIGAKRSTGGQHWVVVTGFNGGELTEANFIINDPGSNVRADLQQFFIAYPHFYKYFTY